MCEPATIAYTAAALVGGFIASKALAPKIPDAASMTPPAAATPPPPTTIAPPLPATQTPAQPVKVAPVQQLKEANAPVKTGRNASSSSTMLTGPTGVDLSSATISKNTLLGQ